MFTRILLATDGSPEAGRAARIAVALSGKLGSELHVVYVGSMPSRYVPAESEILDYDFWKELRELSEREATGKLEELVRTLEEGGGKVEIAHVVVGRPDTEIVRLAEEIDADLVVVGSRGFGRLRRAVMGSVSLSVVRHAHCPVLVVRSEGGDGGHLPRRILLSLDGSKEADAAAWIAVEISAATGSEIYLIRVLETEPYPPYPEPVYRADWEAELERAKRHVRAFLDERARLMQTEGVKIADAHLALGDADKEIVRLAEDMHADLIVVGSRGLGGVRRALMGSVSDSVMRHAHCSVLVVRENRQKALGGRQSNEFGEHPDE